MQMTIMGISKWHPVGPTLLLEHKFICLHVQFEHRWLV